MEGGKKGAPPGYTLALRVHMLIDRVDARRDEQVLLIP